MMSDECGMMNESSSRLAFIIHRSAFIISAKHRLPRRAVGAEVFDGAVALVEGVVEVVRRAFEFGGGGLESLGRRGLLPHLAREPFELLDPLDEREVELVDGVELRFLNLHRVEEAGVAVGSEAHAVLDAVELLQHAVYGADLEEAARRRKLAHQVV